MDKINFDYSMKVIPLPSRKSYINQLINQVEKFLRTVRWKVYFFREKSKGVCKSNMVKDNKFGFKSLAAPPMDQDLRSFELDMKNMVKRIEFHDSIRYNRLQRNIRRDIKGISNHRI